MSEDTARIQDLWDDDWTDEASNQSESDIWMEYETALQRFQRDVDVALDALIKKLDGFADEYGEKTGCDQTDALNAILFRQLENRMVEIGRSAALYPYPGPWPECPAARVPRTRDEVAQVLHDAMDLYERATRRSQDPDPVMRSTQGY